MASAEGDVGHRRGERHGSGSGEIGRGRHEVDVLRTRTRDDAAGGGKGVEVAADPFALDPPRAVVPLEYEPVGHPDERRDVLRRRLLEDRVRRRELLERAGSHDREPVAERKRLDLVVRDVDRGEPEPGVQLVDLCPHLVAQPRIEVRERLVEEHELRACDEPAGERDPLLLPAGELRRMAVEERARVDERRDLLDPLRRLRALDPARAQRVADVLPHGHVRPERVGLEDHPDVALVRRHVDARGGVEHGAVAERDRPGVGRLEACDAAQRRRLAAAARPEEDEELALLDLEVEVVDRGRRRLAAEALRQALDAYVRHLGTTSARDLN